MGSGAHNYRERVTQNADPNRLNLNQHTGAHSAKELLAGLNERLKELDEVDPQGVPLVEFLITAAHAAFKENGGQVNDQNYFDDSVKFLEERYGEENIIATTRHYDELTPHLVAYVVPVREMEAKQRKRSVIVGRDPDTGKQLRETRLYDQPARSILSAKHHFDGRSKLSDLQTDFAAKVGIKHGLERGLKGSRAKHVTVKQFYNRLQQPLAKLPAPPRIGLSNWYRADSLHAEYVQDLKEAAGPVFARARDRDNAVKRAGRGEDWQKRAEEAEEELRRHNVKIKELQQQILELEQATDQYGGVLEDTLKEQTALQALVEKQSLQIKKLEQEISFHEGDLFTDQHVNSELN